MIAENLYAYLIAQPEITNIVSTRVYPVILPQEPIYPAITYNDDDSNYVESFDGQTGLVQSVFQIDAWEKTYAGATTLATAINTALRNTSGAFGGIIIQRCTILSGPITAYENSVEAYRQTQIFSIWNNEG